MRPSVFRQYHAGLVLTPEVLHHENQRFQNTAGVSSNNCDEGFHAAFLDKATGCVYVSRFANGSPAPMHLLEGLPDELVLQRDSEGRVAVVKQTVIAGFLRAGRFYTREQTAHFLDTMNGIGA